MIGQAAASSLGNVRVEGQYACVTQAVDPTPGLRIFDISDPRALRSMAFFPTTGASGVVYPRAHNVAGSAAYVGADSGDDHVLIVADLVVRHTGCDAS